MLFLRLTRMENMFAENVTTRQAERVTGTNTARNTWVGLGEGWQVIKSVYCKSGHLGVGKIYTS